MWWRTSFDPSDRGWASHARFVVALALLTGAFACSPDSGGRGRGEDNDDGGAREGGEGGAGCEEGIDTDRDLLNNDVECMLGLDPNNPDQDGDGLRDGVEVNYPKICVASDSSQQRRDPLPSCTSDDECMAGEVCRGLDPNSSDSDGDGVPDALEDPNGDGTIDPNRGETDPRLGDSDGDGTPDNMEGIAICRSDQLAVPNVDTLPTGATVQLGYDMAWGMTRSVLSMDNMTAGLMLDDPSVSVAATVIEGVSTDDAATTANRIEGQISGATGATGILVGRSFTTHDMRDAVTSFYRIVRSTTPDAIRDQVVTALVGTAPTASTAMWQTSGTFFLEVTTLTNGMGKYQTIVAIAPEAEFNDDTVDTAIRVRDLTNATGVADAGRQLGFACNQFVAERLAQADFLWLVDVSGSMNDDQERLGRVAERFFTRLNDAGVDFRVGVFEASQTMVNLDTPGFSFINGTDAMGAQQLQFQVTRGSAGPGDNQAPYDLGNNTEEPVAAGVVVLEEFERRVAAGEMNPDRRLRPDAQPVAFFVTDEPGTNDDGRYFSRDTGRWGADGNARIASVTDFYAMRNVLTFGLIRDFGQTCPATQDLPKCVILGNSGAFIPITTASDPEVAVAMDRVVEAVAGAASTFVLSNVPISSTLKVAVDAREVPRSRAEGFDYDGASNSIVFRGTMFRPELGSEVVVSYRLWGNEIE
ncbi:MAG: hypothetical protein AAGF12_13840 [Myxococcota bacterium]